MVITKANIDFGEFQVKFQTARKEISQRTELLKTHRDIMLYVCDQFLEGIARNKLCSYSNNGRTPMLSINLERDGIFLKFHYRASELYKAFKNVQEPDLLIDLLEQTVESVGMNLDRGNKKHLGVMEVYLKT